MKRIFIFALFMACAGLACTLTNQGQQAAIHAPVPAHPSRQTPTMTLRQMPPLKTFQDTAYAPKICRVKTGLSEGRLNIRSCGGLACHVLAVIREGETLTPTQTEPINGWLEVQASSLRGWVNSELTTCEVKK